MLLLKFYCYTSDISSGISNFIELNIFYKNKLMRIRTTMSVVCHLNAGLLAATVLFQKAFGLVSITVCAANWSHRRFAKCVLWTTAFGNARTIDRAVRSFPTREVLTRVYAWNGGHRDIIGRVIHLIN